MANIPKPLANIYKTSFLIRQTFVLYTNTLAMNQIIQMTHRHEAAPLSTPIKQQAQIWQLNRKLALPTAEGTYYVRWNDISYCVAKLKYV